MSYFINFTSTYFDNEDGDNDGKQNDDKDGQGDGENKPKTYTPEQVDVILQDEKTKFQAERTKMLGQLEDIQKTSTLNEQQRIELEDQVTALREASMTTEERARAALERKEQVYGEKLAITEGERDSWQDRYHKTRINNALLSAANNNELKPFHSGDIVNALGDKTYLKDQVDDLGKKTGNFDVLVKFEDVDEDGKTTIVEMDPGHVVARMSKMTRWSHLFQSNKTSGSSGSVSSAGEEVDLVKLAKTDPKKFLELTNEKPELLE